MQGSEGYASELLVRFQCHWNTFRIAVAQVVRRREDKVYVHFVGRDKRLDFWMLETKLPEPLSNDVVPPIARKRKRVPSIGVPMSASASGSGLRNNEASPLADVQTSISAPPAPLQAQTETRPAVELTEEDIDIREHRKITAKRNFDKVNFGRWQIKTW